MQIQALHTAHQIGWIPAYDWWSDHQTHTPFHPADAGWVEQVPVMPATVLGLELLLQDRCVDLRMATDLILRDVGATLQIMRLAGQEGSTAPDYPRSITACLVALDVSTWFSALSAHSLPFSKTPPTYSVLWQHCRAVAQYARLIAESLGEVSPEQAYLAGLLHELENMPHLLGIVAEHQLKGNLALEQVLSRPLLAVLQSAKQNGTNSIWRYILASAHALATVSPCGEQAKEAFQGSSAVAYS